ncbi:unnamed protein product [Echinostoma caproni]|uniref:SNF2_N domain-containing protein n=1 Tax=Echinostoma caproni TaxID=27848 RepID=A0A183A089_9TREM|nr:unnamed protein product [Echinostoma caproni]
MRSCRLLRPVVTETTIIQTSLQNTSTLTLAELLARFPLRRPLYIQESGALCYQLIGQLQDNLYHFSQPKDRTSLKFPTLGNIWITDSGVAFVYSSSASCPLWSDWLVALAQTLGHHTLITDTHESHTFLSLIDNLSQPYPGVQQVLERVKIWQTTCLFLCSLYPANQEPNITHLLERLQHRSRKAYASVLCGEELHDKHLFPSKMQTEYERFTRENMITFDRHNMSTSKLPTADQLSNSTNRDAFNSWVERWKYVNAEFLARQLVRQGSNTTRHDCKKAKQKICVAETESCSQSNPCMNEVIQPVQSLFEFDELDPSSVSFQKACMRTLKSMYSSLIGRPLSLLQNGLKDVRLHLGPGVIQSGTVVETLQGLDRLLRSSDQMSNSSATGIRLPSLPSSKTL